MAKLKLKRFQPKRRIFVVAVCRACGNSFQARFDSKGLFCSLSCAARLKPHTLAPRIEKSCVICATSIVVRQRDVERGRRGKVCSPICKSELMRRIQTGETNSYFKHGLSQTRAYINALSRRDYPKRKHKLSAYRQTRRARLKQAEGSHAEATILFLLKFQKERCAYCKTSIRRLYHVDHIIPLSKGGSNWPSNLQLLCARCNLTKRNKLPEQFARTLGLLL